MEQYKTCTKCGQTKPRTKKFFYANKNSADGLRPDCSDCGRERSKKYSRENAEANRARVKAWREADPAKAKSLKSQSYQKHKIKIRAKWREQYKANPSKFIANKHKRRAKEQNVVHLPYATEQVLETYGSDCYLCNKPIDLQAPRWTAKPGWEMGLHLDHVIRIADGGPDTLENVRPTHGICNLKKH